jgi:hypothetical protein
MKTKILILIMILSAGLYYIRSNEDKVEAPIEVSILNPQQASIIKDSKPEAKPLARDANKKKNQDPVKRDPVKNLQVQLDRELQDLHNSGLIAYLDNENVDPEILEQVKRRYDSIEKLRNQIHRIRLQRARARVFGDEL